MNLKQKKRDPEWKPTSPNRSASGCALKNLFMFPFSIHSDAISNGNPITLTPTSGSTFGCRRYLHGTTSLQKAYTRLGQCIKTLKDGTICDPRQVYPVSDSLSIVSKPLLQQLGCHIHPSTRPRTHHRPTSSPFGYRRERSGTMSEGGGCAHTSCKKL